MECLVKRHGKFAGLSEVHSSEHGLGGHGHGASTDKNEAQGGSSLFQASKRSTIGN